MGETIIKGLVFLLDHMGIVFGILFAVLAVAVAVRLIIKMHRGEEITITPVGIANDLPDSVTGLNKYSDALDSDKKRDKE